MKILLKSLTMINFMGETLRKTEFHLNAPTIIAGKNGLGKTRHFDAFTWLLFGKDSQDRENYEIKTIVNGEQLTHCSPCVEAELVVDGEFIVISRKFQEQWVKPKGQSEHIFKGNETKCMWNGVPIKVTEFQKRINEIIEASVFKMLTNPLYFATLPWEIQREQLFQLAGEIKPSDIAEGNPAFMALLDRISGKSLMDFKKELAFRKSNLKSELKTIEPRIEQTRALMPEPADYTAIEQKVEYVDSAIADIDKQIADVTASVRAAYQAEQAKVDKVNQLQIQMSEIVHKAEVASRDAVREANEARREMLLDIQGKKKELENDQRRHKDGCSRIAKLTAVIAQTEASRDKVEGERNAFRDVVKAEKAKTYDGAGTCPVCGQQLPPEKIAEAEAEFLAAQQEKVRMMIERGKAMNGTIAQYESALADLNEQLQTAQAEVESLRVRIAEAESAIAEAERTLQATPEREPASVNPETMPEWVHLRDEAESVKASINHSVTATADTSEYTRRKTELYAERELCVRTLADRDVIARMKTEIERLQAQGKNFAQQIADIEREEFTIQEFTAANIAECERRVNKMFSNVTFRLFKYTQEGNPVETCIPLVNGVPFGRANTAGRINAGLDIINALCKHYGTDAPIFLDNAESVNEFAPVEGQVIEMRVTTDPQLVII